jgi:hypothetical protein
MNQSTWNKIKKWAQILTVIFLVACVYSILKMASANTNARSGNAGFMIGIPFGIESFNSIEFPFGSYLLVRYFSRLNQILIKLPSTMI